MTMMQESATILLFALITSVCFKIVLRYGWTVIHAALSTCAGSVCLQSVRTCQTFDYAPSIFALIEIAWRLAVPLLCFVLDILAEFVKTWTCLWKVKSLTMRQETYAAFTYYAATSSKVESGAIL